MTKKLIRRSGKARPDRRSKKRSGYVGQTLRPSVAENKLIREAAKLEAKSINEWAVPILVKAATARIEKEQRKLTLNFDMKVS